MNRNLTGVRSRFSRTLRVLLFPLVVAGCSNTGEGLGAVEGVIQLDGKPLSGASVIFEPLNGSPSIGYADEDGQYELRFSRHAMGATVGDHKVRVSTAEDQEGRRSKERVPARYNVKTELTASVKSGHNSIDFDLNSGGPVVQPRN
ncbi:hypothetical protein Pan44_39360 [Caulifigura coniformis]|uniref:Carboxypeptidase regulatory-like domain-containing protein n=1 Tax=Caulifigura coniformis TaxID=2527983 RepID=A0A517SID8_9PLAN|nr:carboxypeptidase regulatory-like domain-containing protein [Caulifigura coniformis]QDT55888.1 hypothetical protein Pan44_39360 [Caulifigura coniformis]